MGVELDPIYKNIGGFSGEGIRNYEVRSNRSIAGGTGATVTRDSLADKGIFDGDRLVCKSVFDGVELRSGKLVVMRTPTGRIVVNRIFFYEYRVIIRSSDSAYEEMVFDLVDIVVEGTVKS